MAFQNLVSGLWDTPPVTLALFGGGAVIATGAFYEFWSWYRLSHVPGPLSYSLSIWPMNRLAFSGVMSFELQKFADKYGPLVRVGPNEILFGDAETYRKLSGVRSGFVKGSWYTPSRVLPDQDSLFSMRDEEYRKELKTKLTPGYSGRENGGFEPTVDKHVTEFVNLIERKYLSMPTDFRPIEFSHKAQYFALDVISDIGFGEAVGFLSNDKDMFNYVTINDSFVPIMVVLLNMPGIAMSLKRWPFSNAMPKDSDMVGFGRMMGWAKGVVDRRLEPDAKPGRDMITSHIRNGLTRKELIAEVFMEMIAGSDSTATAIRMTMLCLLTTPSALLKLREEIDKGIAAGQISSPIQDEETKNLPYLQAVLKEVIRMYPPSTGLNYKEVPRGGVTLFGYKIPAGTQLGVNVFALMRSKDTFGPDAEVFRPERWLDGDEERVKEMSGVVELAFGYGKFQCLGKVIAGMEMNKVSVELLRRYDFSIMDPVSPMMLRDCAFWVANDFRLRVTRRAEVA